MGALKNFSIQPLSNKVGQDVLGFSTALFSIVSVLRVNNLVNGSKVGTGGGGNNDYRGKHR